MVKFEEVTQEEILSRLPNKEFHVWWLEIKQKDVDLFRDCLNNAKREEDIQKFLQENPMVLVQNLTGGHGRWVFPKQKLGSEYVTDFIIGYRDSLGFEWMAVELENPSARLLNKNGDLSSKVNHAIRQIADWRIWLKSNQNYASRSRDENGLGLTDIDSEIEGLIIIGRRNTRKERERRLLKQIGRQQRISIHTYDWLLDVAQYRADAYARHRN